MSINIDDTEYYDINFIKDKNPNITKGCATLHKIISKNNIPQSEYVFVSYSKNKAKYTVLPMDTTYKLKKLMIKMDWVHKNILPFCQKRDCDEKEVILTRNILPDKLLLEDHEHFRDKNNDIIHITIRGERKYDGIFFKAKDVGEMLNISKIRNTLVTADNTFQENVDYVYFQNKDQNGKPDTLSNNNKVTYLTYQGFLRLLFVRRHPIAQKFCRWATETLFAAQYGTKEQRMEVTSQIMGVHINTIKDFMDTSTTSLSVIYIFYLGTMGEIRTKLGISADKYPQIKDTYHVFKYGLTDNLKKRAEQHEYNFRKYDIQPMLKYHAYVDKCYLHDAETDLRNWLKKFDWHLQETAQDMTEMAAIQSNFSHEMLRDKFVTLGKEYSGKLKDIIASLENIQNEKKKMDTHISDLQKYNEKMEVQHQQDKQDTKKLLEKMQAQHQQDRQDTHCILDKMQQERQDMKNLYERYIAVLEKNQS